MNKFSVLILICVLITLERISVVYSQGDTSSGHSAIPDGQTWYICSKGPTNFISYTVKVVETSEKPTEGFGTVAVGNRPRSFDQEGLLVFVADYTNLHKLIDPAKPQVQFYQEHSCTGVPVKDCTRRTDTPILDTILCLAIMNPNQKETKFTASISFSQNANQPILVIPPPPDPTTSDPNPPKSTTKSARDPSDTRSFFVDTAARSEINFGYLLVISWLSIFLM